MTFFQLNTTNGCDAVLNLLSRPTSDEDCQCGEITFGSMLTRLNDRDHSNVDILPFPYVQNLELYKICLQR